MRTQTLEERMPFSGWEIVSETEEISENTEVRERPLVEDSLTVVHRTYLPILSLYDQYCQAARMKNYPFGELGRAY